MKYSRSVRTGIWLLITAMLAMACIAALGNTYRFQRTIVSIPLPDGRLEGALTLPREAPHRGLVIMVHGDSAVNLDQDGLYAPWFEGAADAGFATLSWSKPGVGGSTGNWLDQSMGDRADEVNLAIDWAVAQSDIPTERIILWGASQAGWVLPKVAASRGGVDGMVAVGTAINWLSQGRFNLVAELDDDGTSEADRARAVAESDSVRQLLSADDGFTRYLATTTDTPPMTVERWGFVKRNMSADASEDLRQAARYEFPVLLLAGSSDRNVDVGETERVYGEIFGDALTVQHVEGAHSMARPIVEESHFVGLLVGILWPRALLAPHTIDSYTEFLRTIP